MKYLPLLFLSSILFFSCSEKEKASSIEHFSSQLEPYEEHLLLRSYPDKKIAFSAFEKGLKEAKANSFLKDVAGFEEEWTVQGPGNIGARVNTIAVHPENEDIIYIGFGRGGVWKTINGGQDWFPIFDDQLFLSIGDIEIDPNDPNILYVGTGDPNISGYPGIGNGVYKSEDAGETWTHLGLTDTRITSRILVDPNNSDKLYVGTMGIPFEPTTDKGLYRSTDGGNTWEQSLFIGDTTGIIDVVINPQNTDILYAAAWNRLRNNQESSVHGYNAKIWKTTNGGNTWTALQNGLPSGDLGRIGLTISATNPDKIYALYVGPNSQLFGIYLTENGGDSWTEINTTGTFENYPDEVDLRDFSLAGFGWYFAKIRINPFNDNQIYFGGVELWKADIQNNTATWSQASPPWYEYTVHADKHDLVWTPTGDMLLGTDGGLYKSTDNGETWTDIENIPTSQFYRVAYNPHEPNFYYGGMQDNGTSGGNENIINDWPRIYGGDGFQPAFDPQNPNVFYVETQRGGIRRTSDGGTTFPNATFGIDANDRKNWDMQYMISHHNSDVLYTGTQFAYQGVYSDSELFWSPVSEDLTDGNIFGSAFHTISTLDESHFDFGTVYYGTTDGNVQRVNALNETSQDITNGLPNRYVTDIKTSPSFENTIYVTHSGYKDNDFIPRVHRSDNQGDNWTDISGNLPNLAINDIYILPDHQDSILFVASDGGVYASLNSGENWARLGSNMPFIPVYDLELNVEKNELIAGTFARSIMTYPIDSLLLVAPTPPDTTTVATLNFKKKFNQLKITPTLATDFIEVHFEQSEPNKSYELVLLNQQGQVVFQQKKKQEGTVLEQINVNNLPSGSYFIKVKYRHTLLSGRFIKI